MILHLTLPIGVKETEFIECSGIYRPVGIAEKASYNRMVGNAVDLPCIAVIFHDAVIIAIIHDTSVILGDCPVLCTCIVFLTGIIPDKGYANSFDLGKRSIIPKASQKQDNRQYPSALPEFSHETEKEKAVYQILHIFTLIQIYYYFAILVQQEGIKSLLYLQYGPWQELLVYDPIFNYV
jgi:hypothetical protein